MFVDVLVIGSGGAGLTSAIEAKRCGVSVALISKNATTSSQTSMAQGGINAVIDSFDDSITSHIQDTIKSSHELANFENIKYLCENGEKAIKFLDSCGVAFSRENGNFAKRKLGGASNKRALYAQDYTGLKITQTLYDVAIKEGVTFFEDRFLLSLIHKDKEVFGGVFFNIKSGEIEKIYSKATILATGGYAKIYGKFSTNSYSATGDGLVCALKSGATLSNLEFIQFHPTGLKNSSILISESARGEGGYLLCNEERFIDELLPRDVISVAMAEKIKDGKELFLDIRHLGDKIDELLPQEKELCKIYANLDPKESLIPITPVAHYTMGGVKTNIDTSTELKRFFCVGEVSDSFIHGANRLGGNSLLEIIVFGLKAGEMSAKLSKESEIINLDFDYLIEELNYECKYNFYEHKNYLAELFYKHVGILRDKSGLEFALKEIEKLQLLLPLSGVKDKSLVYNRELVDFLEYKNMLILAREIIKVSLNREESRGAFRRIDFNSLKEPFCSSVRL